MKSRYGLLSARFFLASVLPGIPFFVARHLLHQRSGIVNLDFFVLTLLAATGYVSLASVLFVCTCALEMVRLLDAMYFFSQQDLAFLLRFLVDAPRGAELAWFSLALLLCLGLLLLWRMLVPAISGRQAWIVSAPFGALIFVMLLIDVAQGYNPVNKLQHGRAREHMIGEVMVRMPLDLLSGSRQHIDTTSIQLPHSATDPLWKPKALLASKTDVVVVVVESMGWLTRDAARSREFAALDDATIEGRYNVSEGGVPFHGGTVPGEMRELCHLGTGFHVTEDTLAGKPACLPSIYAALGYRTASYHGYREAMFRREDWYPLLGFQKETFFEQMAKLPSCNGAFWGVCDTDVERQIDQRLSSARATNGPLQFLYWMTLNSHLPVDVSHAPHLPCPLMAGTPEVCAQLAYVQLVLRSLRTLALDPRIGRTAIVVVGDHAPPYVSPKSRDLFNPAKVPYITLLPRDVR